MKVANWPEQSYDVGTRTMPSDRHPALTFVMAFALGVVVGVLIGATVVAGLIVGPMLWGAYGP